MPLAQHKRSTTAPAKLCNNTVSSSSVETETKLTYAIAIGSHRWATTHKREGSSQSASWWDSLCTRVQCWHSSRVWRRPNGGNNVRALRCNATQPVRAQPRTQTQTRALRIRAYVRAATCARGTPPKRRIAVSMHVRGTAAALHSAQRMAAAAGQPPLFRRKTEKKQKTKNENRKNGAKGSVGLELGAKSTWY